MRPDMNEVLRKNKFALSVILVVFVTSLLGVWQNYQTKHVAVSLNACNRQLIDNQARLQALDDKRTSALLNLLRTPPAETIKLYSAFLNAPDWPTAREELRKVLTNVDPNSPSARALKAYVDADREQKSHAPDLPRSKNCL